MQSWSSERVSFEESEVIRVAGDQCFTITNTAMYLFLFCFYFWTSSCGFIFESSHEGTEKCPLSVRLSVCQLTLCVRDPHGPVIITSFIAQLTSSLLYRSAHVLLIVAGCSFLDRRLIDWIDDAVFAKKTRREKGEEKKGRRHRGGT
jgi:hypothetical protein